MITNYYPIDIKKEVLVLDLTYSYTIYHPDNLTGDVGVIVKKAKDFEGLVKDKSLEENIKETDFCAEIVNFFPNGSESDRKSKGDKKYMRKGVGTRILNKVIDDCKSARVKFLYVKTSEDSMLNFLRKKKFNELSTSYDVENHFYIAL